MDILEKAKQKLAEQKAEKKPKKLVVSFLETTKKETKIPRKPFIDILKSDEITMDEARAQYIVICKKKPKHDSIQTKNWLINEVMKTLERSKTK